MNDNSEYQLICAIDIGGTKAAGAILKYDSENPGKIPEIIVRKSIPTHADTGCDALIYEIGDMIEELMEETADIGEVSGIGVGTGGRVNIGEGRIVYASDIMPGWMGTPVGDYLRERFSLPVEVLNDVQAWALGEARLGAARSRENAVIVAIGTGFGGAAIVDGKLMRGTHGFAGELGHTFHPSAANIECSCGQMGHIEAIAAGSSIERLYKQITGASLTGERIAELAEEGEDADAVFVIAQSGRATGESLGVWANMFDPDILVLGGSVAVPGGIWERECRRGLAQSRAGMDEVPLGFAALGDIAPLVGAAEGVRDIIGKNDSLSSY